MSSTVELDTKGLCCPLPLLKAKQALNSLEAGQCLVVEASDAGSERDFKAFCKMAGHQLLAFSCENEIYTYTILKA